METNTQRILHTFSALADLGQEIADTGDFEEMLRNSFHLLLGSLAIRRGAVAEYDSGPGQLRFIATRGLGEAQSAFGLSVEYARELASAGSTITLNEATKQAQRIIADHPDIFTSEVDLLVPLVVREELIGIVLLGEKASGEKFTEEDLEVLSALS